MYGNQHNIANTSLRTLGKTSTPGAAAAGSTFAGALNYTKVTEYQLGALLGQGNYAQVKQATHKATGMQVAIKIYDKFKLSANAQIKKSVQREIKLLSILSNTDRDARGTAMMEDFG